jgi:hypothetical protein
MLVIPILLWLELEVLALDLATVLMVQIQQHLVLQLLAVVVELEETLQMDFRVQQADQVVVRHFGIIMERLLEVLEQVDREMLVVLLHQLAEDVGVEVVVELVELEVHTARLFTPCQMVATVSPHQSQDHLSIMAAAVVDKETTVLIWAMGLEVWVVAELVGGSTILLLQQLLQQVVLQILEAAVVAGEHTVDQVPRLQEAQA